MLLDKFNDYIRQNGLCAKSDRILLAISGGVDSMVMLSLFSRAGYDIGVAHCNFQLRGAESDEDDVVVESEANRYGVPFYGIRFDTEAEMAASGESVQMAARRLRYAWFDSLCTEHGYTHIAIAHQVDDSVETFFINLLRGTGLRGLTGINVVNGRVIRPLLFAPRRDITEYAITNKIPYREDSSNSSTKYLRNKIRLGIIPRIREVYPAFTDVMTANVGRLTETQNFIDSIMETIRDMIVEREDDRVIINYSKLEAGLPLKFIIFELMHALGFRGEVTDSLCRALNEGDSTGKKFYAHDMVAYIDRDRIIITPIEENDICSGEIPAGTKRICVCGTLFRFEHLDIDDIDDLNQPEHIALLDDEKVKFPLTVRRWTEGDSFVPFGMTGRKKVSDFLIDDKVAVPDKKRQLVVTSGDDIIWLVNRRIDDNYRITPQTREVLRIVRILE